MAGGDLIEVSLCPCGEEPRGRYREMHAIGVRCRELVVAHVRRRFGPHRYAGRFAADVEDIVQKCYQKLLGPSGLDSFTPKPEREQRDAFQAWLWTVVCSHCNNKLKYFKIRPIGAVDFDDLPERCTTTTPEEEFVRTLLREMNQRAVAAVERSWRAKGPEWGERFDAILPLVYAKEADSSRALRQLGIKAGHLRRLKGLLTHDIRSHVRGEVREGLRLTPEMDSATIERRIDQEITDLFDAAYPEGDVPYTFWSDDDDHPPDPEANPNPDPNRQGEQPEATP